MNLGPDNFGNGTSKTDDRFSGPLGNYRGSARREGGGDPTIDDLAPRNGSPIDRITMPLDTSPIASSLTPPKLSEPSLSDLGTLSEPMFGGVPRADDSWLDTSSGSLADHPLLRGLLLELPPKGAMPQQEWLDRWFEAARSILELIYTQEARALK